MSSFNVISLVTVQGFLSKLIPIANKDNVLRRKPGVPSLDRGLWLNASIQWDFMYVAYTRGGKGVHYPSRAGQPDYRPFPSNTSKFCLKPFINNHIGFHVNSDNNDLKHECNFIPILCNRQLTLISYFGFVRENHE